MTTPTPSTTGLPIPEVVYTEAARAQARLITDDPEVAEHYAVEDSTDPAFRAAVEAVCATILRQVADEYRSEYERREIAGEPPLSAWAWLRNRADQIEGADRG